MQAPFAPISDHSDSPDVVLTWDGAVLRHSGGTGLEKVDSAVADRFWKEVRRFGWWGEAYLEMLMRISDDRSSENGGTSGLDINGPKEAIDG